MNSAIERLLSLRAADVMQRNVMTVLADSTMKDAAKQLLKNHVSGVPVIDRLAECVGILSAVDFVRRDSQLTRCGDQNANTQDLVRTYMSSSVWSINSEATLIDAARLMCEKHVHRLPILDRSRRTVGFISALDVVAAMVHAVEE